MNLLAMNSLYNEKGSVMTGTYDAKHKGVTPCATRTIIIQREKLNYAAGHQPTVRVRCKIENATNFQTLIAYRCHVNLKPACFSTDREFLSVFTSCSSDLTFLTLKEKS